jgi:hypothetical protein
MRWAMYRDALLHRSGAAAVPEMDRRHEVTSLPAGLAV